MKKVFYFYVPHFCNHNVFKRKLTVVRLIDKAMHSKHDIFLKNVEEAHKWLNDICLYANIEEEFQALKLLRVVLHELRDHLALLISAKLSAQLPLLIRGIYFENWNPEHLLLKEQQDYLFADSVAEKLRKYIILDNEKAIIAVFKVLTKHTALERSYHLEQFLPAGIFTFWLKALEPPNH